MNPGMGGGISAAEFLDYRELDGSVFQTSAIHESRTFTVRAADGTLERVQGALVSGNFLRVLGREPALGNTTSIHWILSPSSRSVSRWPPLPSVQPGTPCCVRRA